MIFQLFRQNPQAGSMARLYGAIVAQARIETFYREYGVPDSLSGRFEMVVLHTVLALRRLDHESTRAEGQILFDLFCRDMDANLREIGIGDLSVPREMRKMGEAFYGRQAAYEKALTASDRAALVAALARNVFGRATGSGEGAERLADYVMDAERQLAAQQVTELSRGEVRFPDPRASAIKPAAPADVG
jgi:cytochrome b pre-mRNA-processing protein 3